MATRHSSSGSALALLSGLIIIISFGFFCTRIVKRWDVEIETFLINNAASAAAQQAVHKLIVRGDPSSP